MIEPGRPGRLDFPGPRRSIDSLVQPSLNFGVLGQAVLLVLGVLWLKEMLPRWRADLHTLRAPEDRMDRAVVGCLWIATAVIGVLVVVFVFDLVARLTTAL